MTAAALAKKMISRTIFTAPASSKKAEAFGHGPACR
jgi:hypothetical protein